MYQRDAADDVATFKDLPAGQPAQVHEILLTIPSSLCQPCKLHSVAASCSTGSVPQSHASTVHALSMQASYAASLLQ